MKKILFLFLIFICGSTVFALDYPTIMNNGTIFFNTGIGFGAPVGNWTKDKSKLMRCPPMTVSMDMAFPLGGAPFSLGLITGYFSERDRNPEPIIDFNTGAITQGTQYKYNYIPVGFRLGFHLPINVPRLDTYVLMTLGAIVALPGPNDEWKTNTNKRTDLDAYTWYGTFSFGVRYFFVPSVGVYAEFGIDRVQILTLGLTFKI